MTKILLAIPAYRCAPQIGRTLAGLSQDLLNQLDAVLVIDNQSPDATVANALNAIEDLQSPKVWVVRNQANYGLGGSHKAAFAYAQAHGFDWVCILHGDNQAKTEEVQLLLDAIEHHPEADAVLGSRFMRGATLRGYSKTRTWGNRGLNALYSLVAMRPSHDLGSGLNAFRVKSLQDQAYLWASDRMTFNIDLLLLFFQRRARLIFVPITWSEADQVSNAHNMQVGTMALRALLRWRIGKPMRHEPRPDGYVFDTVGME